MNIFKEFINKYPVIFALLVTFLVGLGLFTIYKIAQPPQNNGITNNNYYFIHGNPDIDNTQNGLSEDID